MHTAFSISATALSSMTT